MTGNRLALLLTCYNRKPKTLACLDALFAQILPPEVTFTVYLVDDGCTDGTAEAVGKEYPAVKILQGNGNLFWTGGMALAFREAMAEDYDYYLWINDDTLLYPEAISNLLATSHHLIEEGHLTSIVVGSTRDPETGTFTYGGLVQHRWWHPLRLGKVIPNQTVQRCDTMAGNCVLIPRNVVQVVGNLDSALTHYGADLDYGLRARSQGCTIWVAPGYVGTCSPNPSINRYVNSEDSLGKQWQKMNQPKGLALPDVTLFPIGEWKVLTQRHGGIFWPIYWLLPYRRLIKIFFFGKPQS
ncbi:MAG TPA: glycosyltransferase family 2 protein [Cyanobacteria bacterium UBA11149]|nr:glycosyltransferase family 2 protein [Cyanobacteria bacterium UBA11367]HBE56701.1 glycosyltransferase family 2 protein [Cyanobacteria bacterium UBA11366]HBK63012.1 glycosyltransferase family 2 protein [Cyanobacteria bacterium UBA11166]HBR72313.1 glycosyltransferase family 2 protein [Cyanobacteria bacterium UBA11159]HBS70387.1 glycosyltransferase family 2 protein [Cyanobacteria bacterium UBA11153]HBW87587.1 glycosyltransferase family 2 protein [Cyanobacteria bacterium UBA11149]HCA97163.1 gl